MKNKGLIQKYNNTKTLFWTFYLSNLSKETHGEKSFNPKPLPSESCNDSGPYAEWSRERVDVPFTYGSRLSVSNLISLRKDHEQPKEHQKKREGRMKTINVSTSLLWPFSIKKRRPNDLRK